MKLKIAISIFICGFITLCAQNAHAQSSISVSGEVLASTPCELEPPSDVALCPQVVLPIEAAILAQRTQGRRLVSRLIYSDSDGNLSAQLAPGTYLLKLRRAKIGGSSGILNAKNLRISPAKILVRAAAAPTLLLVTHKDRTSPSITVGYAK